MKKSTIFGAGMIAGGLVVTATLMYVGPHVRSAEVYDSDPRVPNVIHLDTPQQVDRVLVQTTDGSYVTIGNYLRKHVPKEDRAVQKALIERMVETERDTIVKE